MFDAGLVALVVVVFAFFLLFGVAEALPDPFQRYFGYFMLFVSTIELILLAWVLVVVATSEWTLLSLSIDDFWREQLSALYFIKEWLYSWFWNDFLNIFFVFLPAVVFLTIRTVLTTFLGMWALAASKRSE